MEGVERGPRLAAAASPPNVLEMHILDSPFGVTESETLGWAQWFGLTKPCR